MIGKILCAIGKALGGCVEASPPPTLETSGGISIDELSSILIDKFPDAPLYLPDSYYYTCTVDDIKRFLGWDIGRESYRAEVFDCDDYSWRLKGNITIYPWSTIPFFVVWTDKHAMNGFIDNKGDFYFIEPQTDEIQTELEDWQGSAIRFMGG